MFEASDDYDFTPSASSNLASLFGASMTVPDASLTYTAPKQPKPVRDNAKKSPPKVTQQSVVVCAKVISLYKLANGEYDALGKHGLALIKAETQSNQELLIYKEKTNIITRCKIKDKFQLYVQNDSFCSFIDDSNQTWLLKFDSLQDRDAVSTELKKLGGSIIDNTSTVTKDNNLTSPAKEQECLKGDAESTENVIDNVQDLSKSSNEEKTKEEEQTSDSSQSQVKADILSRMAKMGQLVMSGNQANQPIDMSDSDTTDSKQVVNKPQRKPRKLLPHRDREATQIDDVNKPRPADRSLHTVTNMAMAPHQFQSEALPVATNSITLLQPNALEKILIDNRTRDTDLKLNLCEISTKLDYLIKSSQSSNHLTNLPTNTVNAPHNTDDAMLKSKLKALQLKTENLSSELQNLQIKYSQLQEENRALEEKLKTTDGSEMTIQSQELKITELECDVKKLKADLEASKRLQTEIEEYKVKVVELTEELTQERIKNADLVSKAENCTEVKGEESIRNKIPDIVKQRMNNMFEEIMSSLGDKSEEIRSVISQHVRRTAFKILKDFEKI